MGRRSFFVYILASQTRGTLSVRVTNDLARRLAEHRDSGAHTFAGRYGVFRLVHVEEFPTAVEDIRREKALKKWTRQWRIDLIERDNPTWSDLARWPLPWPGSKLNRHGMDRRVKSGDGGAVEDHDV